MPDKKLIVMIDDSIDFTSTVQCILQEQGFEVATFGTFNEALPFLESHKPELIISDLIGHDNINGVEFYIQHIMKKHWNFALWSGLVDTDPKDKGAGFSLFLDGIPKDYRVTYDKSNCLSQKEVDVIITDFKNNTTSTFPAFSKPGELKDIIDFFKLNVNGFIVVYLGTLVEAARLTVGKM